MNVLYEIQEMMDSIMRMMDDGSYFEEYEPEFVAIDNLIQSFHEDDDILCQAAHNMFKSLFENNGSLEHSYTEMLAFQRAVDMAIANLDESQVT